MSEPEHDEETGPVTRWLHRVLPTPWVGSVIAVAAAWICIAFVHGVIEPGPYGQWLEHAVLGFGQVTRAQLQRGHPPPVLVVDISHLPRRALLEGKTLTDRRQLLTLIQAIAAERPLAIGVDIDFSPIPSGGGEDAPSVQLPDPAFDPTFFARLKQLDARLPVRLGVGRMAQQGRSLWLGADEYRELAASIQVPRFADRMLLGIAPAEPGPEEQLESLAPALVRNLVEIGKLRPGQAPWMSEFNKAHHVSHTAPVSRLVELDSGGEDLPRESPAFLIDYALLNSLTGTQGTLRRLDPSHAHDFAELIRDRVVLLGDANSEQSRDLFVGPEFEDPLPGVYVHAAAVCTLLNGPLQVVNSHVAAGAEAVAAALLILFGLAFSRRRASKAAGDTAAHSRQRRVNVKASQWSYLQFLAGAVGVVGLIMNCNGFVWTGFVTLVTSFLLSPTLDRLLEWGVIALGGFLDHLVRRLTPIPQEEASE